MLFSDQPIASSSLDELGLDDFASRFARVIVEWPPYESLVVGLFGSWGSGKTSALNLVEEKLQSGAWQDRAIIVRFNPWHYSDAATLLHSFFSTLRAATNNSPLLSPQQKRSLSTALGAIGKFVIPVFAPLTQVFTGGINVVTPAAQAIAKATNAFLESGELGLEAQRAAAAETLKALGSKKPATRIVVLIDDLDRADRDEVVATLKTVKLIAALPNITYVLAMDHQRLRQTLETGATPFDGTFLEKIIQVPISLPSPTAATVQDLTIGALNTILQEAGHQQRVQIKERLRPVDLRQHVFWRVRTLRDRARLLNAFRVLFLSGEHPSDVDAYDALYIALLQVFFPDVAERIRRNKSFLTGDHTSGYIFRRLTMKADELKKYQQRMFDVLVEGGLPQTIDADSEASLSHNPYQDLELLDAEPDLDDYAKTRIRSMVAALFPAVGSGEDTSGEAAMQMRKDNRISSPERFDRYFAFTDRIDGPPDSSVAAWIASADETLARTAPQTGEEWLRAAREVLADFAELSLETRADVLERILDKVMDVPWERAERIALAVAFGSTGEFVEIDKAVALQRRLLAQVDQGQFTEPRRHRRHSIPDTNFGMERLLHTAFAVIIDEAPDPLDAVAGAGEHVGLWDRRAKEKHTLLTHDPSSAPADNGIGAVVDAGLRRIECEVDSGINIFRPDAALAGRAIWRWRDLLKWKGAEFTPIERYLNKLLAADPTSLPSILTLFGGWSDWGPSLDMQNLAEIRQRAEELVGWRKLLRAVVAFRRLGTSERHGYAHLVDQLAEKVRQSHNRSRVIPDVTGADEPT